MATSKTITLSKPTLRRPKVYVYIGRMQILHNGHVENLQHAFRKGDAVIILVGSSFRSRNIKNPFTFDERKDMILRWIAAHDTFRTKEWSVLPLQDHPYNDTAWIQSVQEAVRTGLSNVEEDANNPLDWDDPEIILVGSDRDHSTWYLHAFPGWKLELKPPVPAGKDLNATALRRRLFTSATPNLATDDWLDVPPTTLQFLQEYVHGTLHVSDRNSYKDLCAEWAFIEDYRAKHQFIGAPDHEAQYITVDCVVVQSGHILAVQRNNYPGRGLWALPGGFVKGKQRLLEAALAELTEETGIRLADGKRSLDITKDILRGSVVCWEYFDDPERSNRGRTLTICFMFKLDDTKPLPVVSGQKVPEGEPGGGVEVETLDAQWIPIARALSMPDEWFEDHDPILRTMVSKLKD